MMDATLAKVLKDYDLPADAVWTHKQSGQTVMKHWACEHVAIRACIVFDMPEIVFADPVNKIATICVRGFMASEDTRIRPNRSEWSFGEAAPYNTQQSYPFAMAEKRAKDRVILKLIGLHGKVYSEEEADDFKAPVNGKEHGEARGPLGVTELKNKIKKFIGDMSAIEPEDFEDFITSNRSILDQCAADLPGWWNTKEDSDVLGLRDRIENQRALIRKMERTALQTTGV